MRCSLLLGILAVAACGPDVAGANYDSVRAQGLRHAERTVQGYVNLQPFAAPESYVVLAGTWLSAPVSLRVDGQEYPVALESTSEFVARKTPFIAAGSYEGVVTLACGDTVTVDIEVYEVY